MRSAIYFMKFRTLGRTGLNISEIGFGCWAIGGTSYGATKDEDSLAALEAAWEAGVNFFDTADTYGHGHSEKLLATFLKKKERSLSEYRGEIISAIDFLITGI